MHYNPSENQQNVKVHPGWAKLNVAQHSRRPCPCLLCNHPLCPRTKTPPGRAKFISPNTADGNASASRVTIPHSPGRYRPAQGGQCREHRGFLPDHALPFAPGVRYFQVGRNEFRPTRRTPADAAPRSMASHFSFHRAAATMMLRVGRRKGAEEDRYVYGEYRGSNESGNLHP